MDLINKLPATYPEATRARHLDAIAAACYWVQRDERGSPDVVAVFQRAGLEPPEKLAAQVPATEGRWEKARLVWRLTWGM